MPSAKTLRQLSVFTLMLAFSCTEDESLATEKTCFITESTLKITGSPTPLANIHIRSTMTLNSENKPVIKRTIDLTGGSNNSETRFFYDNMGRPEKIEYDYSGVTDRTHIITYLGDSVIDVKNNGLSWKRCKYNASKQLVEVQLYTVICSLAPQECYATKGSKTVYEYESPDAENPALYRTSTGWVEITYDDKVGFQDLSDNDTPSPYFNNPIKLIHKDNNGNLLKTVTYEYEYNNEGYPTKMTVDEGGTILVSTYTYTCK